MLKSHERFHYANGKRLILVVDDEIINRELLREILESDYEIIYAEDGEQAMKQCREHKNMLSLVVLDLMMPVMSGIEVLKQIKDDPDLKSLPVIVATSDKQAEVESLSLGAVDFIPKPYPSHDVILARVYRTIELYEDREIISHTERDPLTGLYNREYFYRYAEQFDQHHKNTDMDAMIVDVNHFHMINERFGTSYGDDILRRIGERLREMVNDIDGIVCRREADTFLVYCPHGKNYETILENASVGLTGDDSANNRVRLRMGVYPNVDKSLEVERRFDRAKIAADMVRGSFMKTIGIYNSTMHKKELYDEQLIEDFKKAIAQKQFKVYFQPKFDVRPNEPALSSCEALVRWQHPDLGMISPGVFIPLFENNGLIQELDMYVWRESAKYQREWKERLGYSVPISVNVSRIDMYDSNLVPAMQSIIRDNGISYDDIILEITESAYTQDSEQIVQTVNRLRKLGFRIEMDDFGTGYSSLNMISSLPIDALKLDMQFIRSAFSENGDTRMLEVIIDIADYLKVPVIAEGVETEHQLKALKDMGCDIVQGYYFSKPLPAEEFESFIIDAKRAKEIEQENDRLEDNKEALIAPAEKETSQDTEDKNEPKTKNEKVRHGWQLRTTSYFFVILAFLAAVALFVADISVTRGYERMEQASNRYIMAQLAASNMESGSDYLTDRVRCFVVTGEMEYLDDFFEEVEITKRRDLALSDLETLLKGNDSGAYSSLALALDLSNELVGREYLAMRLVLEAGDYNMADIPKEISSVVLSEEDMALSAQQQREKAQKLVFDNTYMHYKDRIRENVSLCTQELIRTSSLELEQASAQMMLYTNIQTVLTILFLLIVLLIVLFVSIQVRIPLTRMVELMRKQEEVPPTGAEELQFVTRTYNAILKENLLAREELSHEASHDRLTGLFNRGAYEMMLESVDVDHMALILVDVDYFKSVNDTYGHDIGDKVLKRVAEVLKHSFRSVDIICRIGGDEFVVIMTRADSTMRELVRSKIARANELLRNPTDDLPPVSLSVGVAFSDRENPKGDIFKDADTALYRVKEAGRNGCEIF
ncbi:MAG: EAL domain-containing protein [Clostridia bacterium]|nr:EAL domain-containing protein [Clostridia bacterium]